MPDDFIDILLVEDSAADAAFVEHALKETKLGARLKIARDGVEALLLLFGDGNPADSPPIINPKVIILDLKLPKVEGLDLIRLLKGNPHSRSLPVVVLSSSLEKRDLSESYRLGVNAYLVKPMDFDEFAKTVRALGRFWLQSNRTSTH